MRSSSASIAGAADRSLLSKLSRSLPHLSRPWESIPIDLCVRVTINDIAAVYEEEIVKIHDLLAELKKPTATSAAQPCPIPASPTLVANRPRPRQVTEAEWECYLKSHGLWLKEG